MKIYIVIELPKNNVPKMIGAYKNKSDAEKIAHESSSVWRNIIETTVK